MWQLWDLMARRFYGLVNRGPFYAGWHHCVLYHEADCYDEWPGTVFYLCLWTCLETVLAKTVLRQVLDSWRCRFSISALDRRSFFKFKFLLTGLGSIHFCQFNSIPIQVGFGIFQFNSIQIQIGFRIFQFNSNSIHFLSIPIQFNSIFMHRNKQINQLIEYFKFNLNISLFAAQFRKYIIQDHNNSRINKSALVQVLG